MLRSLDYHEMYHTHMQASKDTGAAERVSLELILEELRATQPQSSWHIQMVWLLQLAQDQDHQVWLVEVLGNVDFWGLLMSISSSSSSSSI